MASKHSTKLASQLWCLETTKHLEMMPELAEEIADLIDLYADVLIWCSGSLDFGPGGKAEKGWKKICKPLLNTNLNIYDIKKLVDENIKEN